MKIRSVFLGVLCAAAFGAGAADSTISDLVYRQRWPWSAKVDIYLNYAGNGGGDIAFTATWDGQSDPVELTAPALSGRTTNVRPGALHYEWDPAAAGFGEAELKGFRIEASAPSFADRLYLVVNLVDGSSKYLSSVPAGGWTDCDKTTNMVFRRIPAGTTPCGEYEPTKTAIASGGYTRARTVTFTSDFYLGIFPITFEQSYLIEKGASYRGWETIPDIHMTYNRLRGAWQSDAETSVSWPQTGYKVAPDSIIGKLRAKTGNRFMFDLPQEEQWEHAARCGVTDAESVWANGGVLAFNEDGKWTNTNEVMAVFNTFAMWKDNPAYSDDYGKNGYIRVGLLNPNPWGIYDMIGLMAEWTLDAEDQAYGRDRPDGPLTDPIGRQAKADGTSYRVVRGCYPNRKTSALTGWSEFRRMVPGFRWAIGPGEDTAACGRLAIHLNPLDLVNGL